MSTSRRSPGEVIGIVGESGCGKSTLVTALANLLPDNARVGGLDPLWRRRPVGARRGPAQRLLRGDEIALVVQDPMTAFNPVLTIGDQLVDFQHRRKDLGRARSKARIAAMLARVGISDADAAHGAAIRTSCRAACASAWPSPPRCSPIPAC